MFKIDVKNNLGGYCLTLAFASMMLLPSIFSIGTVNAMPDHSFIGSFVNSGIIPYGSTVILNINYNVTNGEDSGNVGYWALSNYNKQVQVLKASDGTFYVIASYNGSWNTFAGALSPEFGKSESKDAVGTFQGGYVETFSGTFSPTRPTTGYVGKFDFSGTKSDILLGTYSKQTGDTPSFNDLSAYFTGVTNVNESGWAGHITIKTKLGTTLPLEIQET